MLRHGEVAASPAEKPGELDLRQAPAAVVSDALPERCVVHAYGLCA
jgi:hypothetical protein